MATKTFYSNAGGDGAVVKDDSSDWATTRGASTGTVADTSGTNISARCIENGNYTIGRLFLPFDTSSLPDDAIIESVTLMVYAFFAVGDNDGDDYVAVVQSTQASSTTLAVDDFDAIGSTEGSNQIDLSDGSDGYQTFTLNSTGRGWINTTGYTNLGIREGHDLNNSAIAASSTNDFQILSADYSGFAPMLTIKYRTSGAWFGIL